MAPHPEIVADERAVSPMAMRAFELAKSMVKRDGEEPYKSLASAGAKPPSALAGPGFQALFALIGIGMAFLAIWFFFWAKNGGFKWRENDWEDYKSTVLRRKGPDGKTLSNATKSTRLGGGSVVHGGSYFGAQSELNYTDEAGTEVTTSTYRDAERGEGGLRGGDGRKHKKHRRDHTNDYNDPELRQYREEKAARVGGLNRVGDGKYTDYSGSQPSEVGSSHVSSQVPLVKKEAKDPKKEAKAKEQRAKERMRKAKAAEKEAAKKAAAEEKARKDEQKAEAKRAKEEQKRSKKHGGALSEAPEMAEVNRPMIEYKSPQSDAGYTRAETEYTAPSDIGTPTRASTRQKKGPSGPRRAPPSAAYSFTTGDDDAATVYTGVYTNDFADVPAPKPAPAPAAAKTHRSAPRTERSAPSDAGESSYYSDYRPNADPSLFTDPNKHAPRSRSARPSQDKDRASRSSRPASSSRPRPSGSRSRPTSESPRKQHRSSRPAPPPSDIFTTTNGESQGHMSYPCHIPGLSQAGSVHPMESVSQVGAPSNARRERGGRDVMDGYRRGGVRAVGRRDSLSDSD